ncbi:MAG: penicillin-binding protein 1A [Desulfobacteraceae bacterium]|nr:penicillin-binding protein 1A [Desulfobacteraceae bacterium]
MRRVARWLLTTLKWLFYLVIAGAVVGSLAFAGIYFYFSKDLPEIKKLADYQPPVVSTFYSDDGRKIAEFYKERRIVIPLSQMPEHLVNAFIATEDARFYEHEGIDFYSIVRAFFKNLEAGSIVQGGSTITQQVAKSFFLTPERSYVRKLKEAILAYRIDKRFTKDEILYLYLNQIYLGHGAYGVEAAAQNYFHKSAGELTLAEAAMLGGLPRAPSAYSPYRHRQRAKQRQIYVLNRMVTEGFITNLEASEAMGTEIEVHERPNWFMDTAPYYTTHVRKLVEDRFGEKALETGGLKVYTNVDLEMQTAARKSIENGLRALDKRQGYRGPIKHLDDSEIEGFVQQLKEEAEEEGIHEGMITRGVVVSVDNRADTVTVRLGKAAGTIPLKNMRWARRPDPEVPYGRVSVENPGDVLETGDVIFVKLEKWNQKQEKWRLSLEQKPLVQSGLVNMEVGTGRVKTLVGGRDFAESQFNRAVQSRRQPGSAFKPIIYAAALDQGMTPATIIADTPIVFEDKERDFTWKPGNYDRTFHGFTLFREGLIHSRNVVTVKILRDIGIDYAVDYARKLGIESHLDRNLSLALGSSGVSLVELTKAYAVFANQGRRMEPVFIRKVVDRNGKVIYENVAESKEVIGKATAYIMTHLLKEVVQEGTGWRVKALGRPVAGKTGTTNNLNDAWFMGYTPGFVTGVWVGYDHEQSLGSKETGSRAASPIWLSYMKQILKDRPERTFQVPDNVVFAKIDAKTGLLPIESSEKVIYECFKEDTLPTKHTKAPDEVTGTDEFFKKGLQ